MTPVERLWRADSAEEWERAIQRYWGLPSVSQNWAAELHMDKVRVSTVARYTPQQCYDFLADPQVGFYRWKFGARQAGGQRAALDRFVGANGLGEGRAPLAAIFQALVTFPPEDIHEGLRIAREIPGVQDVAGSGLLAILYPAYYGTADQHVVRALQRLTPQDLPPGMTLQDATPTALTTSDVIAVIQIYRWKAGVLNHRFDSSRWRPRDVDMALFSLRA